MDTNLSLIKKTNVSWINIIGSILLTGVLCYWAFLFFTQDEPQTLLTAADFPIHEYLGGLLFLLSFNEVIITFGQNLTNVMVPGFFLFFFLHQKQYVSTAFCLFWAGENIIWIGTYMADAVKLQLALCSGWYGVCGSGSDMEWGHDWHIIFSAWNLLPESEIIGGIFHVLGILCVIASLIVLAYIIWVRIDFKLTMKLPNQSDSAKALAAEIMQDTTHTNALSSETSSPVLIERITKDA